LAIDKNRNFVSVVIDRKIINEEIIANTIIEGIPNRVFGNVIYFTDESSYIRIVTDRYESEFPPDSEIETKIKTIQVSDNPYIVEAIVLQSPTTSNVTTKSGENVTVSDTLIGDDTGELD
jgi:replication factor A1